MALPVGALLALVAAAASVSVRSNKGALDPEVDPTAELLIVLKELPADAAVEVTCTAGAVGALQPLGGGRYRATYTAPQKQPPTMAFITALARYSGDEYEAGHSAIALAGRVELEVAVEPKKKFTVEANGRTFGPFTADAKGRGKAALTVAPRVVEATIHQGDKEKAVPLPAPPVSLVHVAAIPEASHGHGEDPLLLEIYFVDRTGYPGKMMVPKVATDKGMVMQMGPKTTGLFRYVFEAPEGQTEGFASVTAKLPNDADSVDALKIALRPSRGKRPPKQADAEPVAEARAPSVLHLVPSVAKVVAGESGEVMVDVTRYGNPVLAEELKASNAEADLGAVVPVGTQLKWLIPATFGGRSVATMRASVGGSEAEVQVKLEPGPAAKGTVSLDAAQVRAGRSVSGRVQVTDEHFNPVGGAKLTGTATYGSVAAVVDEGGGRYRFSYQAPDAPGDADLSFQVAGGPTVQAPRLTVTPALSGLSLAVGAVVQGRSNLSLVRGGTPQLEVAARLPSLPLEVVVRGGRSFYQAATVPLPGANASQTATFGGFGGEAGLRLSANLLPWLALHIAGAAVGQRTETTVSIAGGPADGIAESTTALTWGGSGGAGGSLRFGAVRLLVEGAYVYLPAAGSLRGNLGGLSANAGVLVELL